MKLSKKECEPIKKNTKSLTEKEAGNYLKELNNWRLENQEIKRNFEFSGFMEAMEFVNKVADIAEKQNHHPDIYISYNQVELTLSTHEIGGLSENDFILAAKIDKV